MLRWLSPPQFDDYEEQRLARLLNILTLALIVGALLYGVMLLLNRQPGADISELLIIFISLIALIGVRVLMVRRQLAVAARLLVFGLWSVMVLSNVALGTLNVSSLSGYIFVLVIGNLFINIREMLILTIGSLLVLLSVGFLETRGLYTPLADFDRSGFSVFEVALFVFSGVVLALNIEWQQETIRKLRQSEERFRLIVDAFPSPLVLYDPNLRIEFINKQGIETGGYAPEVYIGKRDTDLFPPEVTDNYTDKLYTARDTSRTQVFEMTVDLPTMGRYTNVVNYIPLLDSKGNLQQIIGLTYDITERKRHEDDIQEINEALEALVEARTGELRESEERFRQVMETINDIFYLLDVKTGHLLYISRAYEDITGYTTQLIYHDPLADLERLCHPADKARMRASTQKKVANPEPSVLQYRIVTANGDVRWMEEISRPIFDSETGEYYRRAGVVSDITERKQAEQLLEESEARYRGVVESQSEMICRYTPDTRLTFVNGAYCRYFGQSADELIGTSFLELLPEERRDANRAYVASLVADPRTEYSELVSQSPGGQTRWEGWTVQVITDENGQVVELQAVGLEITDRKQAEIALAEREAQLTALMNNFPNGAIIMFDTDMRYIALGGMLLNDLGLDRARFMGNRLYEVFPAMVISQLEPLYRRALAGELVTQESAFNDRHYLMNFFPIYDKAGEIIAGGIVALDITDRKEAEIALAESEAQLRSIMNNFPNGAIVLFDHDLRYLLVDGQGLAEVGLDKAGMEGRMIYEVFPPETVRRIEAMYRQTLQGESVILEVPFKDHFYMTRSNPVYNEAGEVIAGVVITQDITERKEAEDSIMRLNFQLMRQTDQLEAVNRELEAFSYSVSHDLRAPLRSVDGFSQALLEDYGDQLDATAQDYLGRVRRASQRMATLIDDMLKLSRLTRQPLERRTVDLSKVVHDITTDLPTEGRSARFEIVENVTADCDPSLVRIVLENLLNNAWKFTGKETETVIRFTVGELAGEPVYGVCDNGVGFDMHYVNKLFTAFQRLHHDDEFEGSGIGLATVQRLINRHGGRVWAESEPGAGACFYFTLGQNLNVSQD